MLVQIGTIKLYSEKTLAEALGSDDSIPLSTSMPESLTLAEIFPVTTKILNGSSIGIDHNVDGRATCSFTVYDAAGGYGFL
jgi:hypothetical protein